MDSAIFHLDSDELDKDFLKKIKSLFKNQKITLVVMPQKKVNYDSKSGSIQNIKEPEFEYVVPGKDFEKLTDQFFEDETFDIAKAIRQYQSIRLK